MIIAASNVSMESKYKFTASSTKEITTTTTPVYRVGVGGMDVYVSCNEEPSSGGFLSSLNYYLDKDDEMAVEGTGEAATAGTEDVPTKIKFQTLSYLLRIILGQMMTGSKDSFSSMLQKAFTGNATQSVMVQKHISMSYEQTQSQSFAATGTVVTADGEEINFGINLEMSDSFKEELSIDTMELQQIALCDPLVINLNCASADVSDQTFIFDLDADGQEEELSNIGAGSGFLALDKNGDGKINDGSELFGATTGNGFKELALYDSDHNGWIDEADEIFSKLKVMTVDSEGNQELIDLKDADIGAICLASAKTGYRMNKSDNSVGGIIRQNGVFLRESDKTAGTIQHIDLAMKKLTGAAV